LQEDKADAPSDELERELLHNLALAFASSKASMEISFNNILSIFIRR
jgi:hypothetical protein